jgi:hypothetical protein
MLSSPSPVGCEAPVNRQAGFHRWSESGQLYAFTPAGIRVLLPPDRRHSGTNVGNEVVFVPSNAPV